MVFYIYSLHQQNMIYKHKYLRYVNGEKKKEARLQKLDNKTRGFTWIEHVELTANLLT